MAAPKKELKRIANLHNAGIGRAEIAARLGVSVNTVTQRFKELGINQTNMHQGTNTGDEAWAKQASIRANYGLLQGFKDEAEAGSWFAQKVLAERAAAPVETEAVA